MNIQQTQPRPRLTRAEARMIAEEVVRLMREQTAAPKPPPEDYLTAREAAEYLNVSVWYVYHNIDAIPHTTLPGGRRKMFLKSRLQQYIENRR